MEFKIVNANCSTTFQKIIAFALENSTHISLCTFRYYHKKDLNECYFSFLEALEPYAVRNTESFNLPRPYTKGQHFLIYAITPELKKSVQSVASIDRWCAPSYPEDISFYVNKSPWLTTITHEQLAFVKTKNEFLLTRLIALGAKLMNV